jgi:hypothetical protein
MAADSLRSGDEQFTVDDLFALSELVAIAWTAAADRDWLVPAGTLDWTCTATADHAVDCVYAPAFCLASRNVDEYPQAGLDLRLGAAADPVSLVESLSIATRMLAGVVNEAEPDARALIFRHPDRLVGVAPDFVPRAALELILHAHDVCSGLQVPYEPPSSLCHRLREHTRPWPVWSSELSGLGIGRSDDPWNDLLEATGRSRRSEPIDR